ncbi:lysophospholipase L1-like esterase [Scopulibacillus daqui]|uniref:Lysophospholipase L1-like esterase n=1 Tax=Scopulibacillus daqui TaxID=1469162 RepID=A0ABS2PYV8_9BACL|nr:lysophospholipase L1-like esterase [Scopulibacillus daqui]
MVTLKRKIIYIAAAVLICIVGVIFTVAAHPFKSERVEKTQASQKHVMKKKLPVHIVGIGDSLTKGVGDPKNGGYFGDFINHLKRSDTISKVTVNNFGVTGDTTDDLLKVLDQENVKKQLKNADMICLTIGGNDLVNVLKSNFLNLKQNDFETERQQFEKNFNDIIQKIRKENTSATIYYFGLYNPFEDYLDKKLNKQFFVILKEWNHTSQNILKMYSHTVFIPTEDIFKGKTNTLLYKDHFHPNSKGYKLMTKRLLPYYQVNSST